MEYNNAKSLGVVLTSVDLTHRYWKAQFDVSAAVEPEKAIEAAYRWFSGMVDGLIGEIAPVRFDVPKETLDVLRGVVAEPEQEAHAGALGEPQNVPDGDGTADIRALPGPLMIAHVVSDSGTHYAKVLGGKWKKYGISVWGEVLEAANIKGWTDWPVCQNKRDGIVGEKRALPPSMVAFVLFDGEKPQKVVELR